MCDAHKLCSHCLRSEKVTKVCDSDGQWFRHPESNRLWSNYTQCSAYTKQKLKVRASLLHVSPILQNPACLNLCVSPAAHVSELLSGDGGARPVHHLAAHLHLHLLILQVRHIKTHMMSLSVCDHKSRISVSEETDADRFCVCESFNDVCAGV